MRATNLLSLFGGVAAAASLTRGDDNRIFKEQSERALSGSGDMSFDDDFWAYDEGSMDVVWDDYSVEPKTCMIYKNQHVIAFDLFGKGHKQCAKKKEGTYLMDVGKFAKAYVAQKQVDYKLVGNEYEAPDALDYIECTAVEYNDVYYYAKLGCSTTGSLKIVAYTDEYCSQAVSTNIGLYNDVKISFNACQSCVAWPAETGDDDAAEEVELDDNFEYYHAYDSKLCGAADQFKLSCGWGCRKQANKGLASANYNNMKRSWGGFEKFCLFFWSFAAVALVWVVLKQRRMMSREDAIVEEAAMNGVGLKKRHVFPIGLGIIFFVLFAMFMVWKKLTWLLLIGTNIGLFAHFVFLRRKAKKSGAGGDGYVKDAGLEIS
mmetsp:Transcript_3107/g.6437  ORF Transcript_3107/g.6437 Transcript_3107/m.6437 type:complete len:375 (-) Transcript_3107:337-1461(-)|eukprot:CAMPEP_0172550752 /NCGR_PEP_ID=MMETSP1067-20121228/32869_1 /TAXON_ID=265564 ORGANISM="Thalassiosira punctigera, Strain Tpunct2005C2" /NCGR_SAMPLE_ID=MMETSP1067 /ASSEMBLY_ACC=CAM_ASM_000444 /LENGTH=374 /DNA_ID=CAMNT_0013338413 /DNA_START=141 /DNA_END=1265 /DNA_ORIENTATION=+